jgi:hypothetical protein
LMLSRLPTSWRVVHLELLNRLQQPSLVTLLVAHQVLLQVLLPQLLN